MRFSRGDFPFPTILPSVSGFILDTNFYGSIFVNHDIYYVDPSKVFPTQKSLQYVRKSAMKFVGLLMKWKPMSSPKSTNQPILIFSASRNP